MAPLLDQSLAMLREGYAFLPDQRRRAGADVVELRLLGRRAVGGCGREFAEAFYSDRFQRHGVLPEPAGAEALVASTAAWTDVALFTNSKPNATELLRGLGERLQAHWALPELGFAAKESASVAADPDQIDWLAQRFKMVLVAVGD